MTRCSRWNAALAAGLTVVGAALVILGGSVRPSRGEVTCWGLEDRSCFSACPTTYCQDNDCTWPGPECPDDATENRTLNPNPSTVKACEDMQVIQYGYGQRNCSTTGGTTIWCTQTWGCGSGCLPHPETYQQVCKPLWSGGTGGGKCGLTNARLSGDTCAWYE